MGNLVNPAGVFAAPAPTPVQNKHAAVVAKLKVSGQDRVNEHVFVHDFVARTIGFHGKRHDSGRGVGSSEVAQEHVILITIGKTVPGIHHHPGRARGVVHHGRQRPSRLPIVTRLPYAFLVPRTSAVLSFEGLVTHVPTGFATFDQIHQPRLVATVGVVVAGEQVAVIVKRKLLRVAQSVVEHLQTGTVQFTTERGTGMRRNMLVAFPIDEVVSPVTNRPVQASIGTQNQAVHVVPPQRGSNTEARVHNFSFFGDAVSVGIAQTPEVRDVGDPNITTEIQHTGHGAVKRLVEPRTKLGAGFKDPIPVRIHQPRQTIIPARVVGHSPIAFARPLFVHGHAILKRLQLEVVHQPPRRRTVVFHTLFLAGGFTHQQLTPVADGERNRITHQGLGGHDAFAAPVGNLHQLKRIFNRDLCRHQ